MMVPYLNDFDLCALAKGLDSLMDTAPANWHVRRDQSVEVARARHAIGRLAPAALASSEVEARPALGAAARRSPHSGRGLGRGMPHAYVALGGSRPPELLELRWRWEEVERCAHEGGVSVGVGDALRAAAGLHRTAAQVQRKVASHLASQATARGGQG